MDITGVFPICNMVERSVLNMGEKRHRGEIDEAYGEYQISLLWEYQG